LEKGPLSKQTEEKKKVWRLQERTRAAHQNLKGLKGTASKMAELVSKEESSASRDRGIVRTDFSKKITNPDFKKNEPWRRCTKKERKGDGKVES